MNKSELIEVLASKLECSKAQAGRIVDVFTETVVETVAAGNEIRLIGFGTFGVSNRSARTGRNPKTNEMIKIPASKTPKFTAGAQFKAALK